jgi:hypothetical protein
MTMLGHQLSYQQVACMYPLFYGSGTQQFWDSCSQYINTTFSMVE